MNIFIRNALRFTVIFGTQISSNDSCDVSNIICSESMKESSDHIELMDTCRVSEVIKDLELQVRNTKLPFINIFEISLDRQLIVRRIRNAILARYQLLTKIGRGEHTNLESMVRRFKRILIKKDFVLRGEIENFLYEIQVTNCTNSTDLLLNAIISWIKNIKKNLSDADQIGSKNNSEREKNEFFFLLDIFDIILGNIEKSSLYNNLSDSVELIIVISNINSRLHPNQIFLRLENMIKNLRGYMKGFWEKVNHTDTSHYNMLKIILGNIKLEQSHLDEDIFMAHFYISFAQKISLSEDTKIQMMRNNTFDYRMKNFLYVFVESIGIENCSCDKKFEGEVVSSAASTSNKHIIARQNLISLITVLFELLSDNKAVFIIMESIELHKDHNIANDEHNLELCNRIIQLSNAYVHSLICNTTELIRTDIYNLTYKIKLICFKYIRQPNSIVYSKQMNDLLTVAENLSANTIHKNIKHVTHCCESHNMSRHNKVSRKAVFNHIIDVFNKHIEKKDKIGKNIETANTKLRLEISVLHTYIEEYPNIPTSDYDCAMFFKLRNSILFDFHFEISAFEGLDNAETLTNIRKFYKDVNVRSIGSLYIENYMVNKVLLYKFMILLLSYINEIRCNDLNLQKILSDTVSNISSGNFHQINVFIADFTPYIMKDLEKIGDEYQFEWLVLVLLKEFKLSTNISLMLCEEISINPRNDIKAILEILRKYYLQHFTTQSPESGETLSETLYNFMVELDTAISEERYDIIDLHSNIGIIDRNLIEKCDSCPYCNFPVESLLLRFKWCTCRDINYHLWCMQTLISDFLTLDEHPILSCAKCNKRGRIDI